MWSTGGGSLPTVLRWSLMSDRDGIDDIAAELERVIDECPYPGARRHLEDAREKVVGAQRMYDWEERGQ